MMLEEQTALLREMIDGSKNIVFFGGAGVSTESGIPDFRSKDGLYNQKFKYPPEQMLSRTFFERHTDEFYEFYKEKLDCRRYEPNIIHIKLAEMEKSGKLKSVITQNIDGLHQKAGSVTIRELHGSTYKNYCQSCNKKYSADFVFDSIGIPRCECGGIVRPNVTLYEEALDERTSYNAMMDITRCDMLIVGGTSLTVYPAAGFLNYYEGNKLVLINRDKTGFDHMANLVIHDSLKKVFEQL